MLISIIVNYIPIILAIVLHEVAHGYAAYWCGDDTAKQYQRLSLNPLRHVDLFGTLILPTLLLLSKTGFIFGFSGGLIPSFLSRPLYSIISVLGDKPCPHEYISHNPHPQQKAVFSIGSTSLTVPLLTECINLSGAIGCPKRCLGHKSVHILQ